LLKTDFIFAKSISRFLKAKRGFPMSIAFSPRRSWLYVFVIMALILGYATVATAQSEWQGRVVDENGAAIPFAQIVIKKEGRTVSSTLSDSEGRFSIPPEEKLTLTVTAEGFEAITRGFSTSDRNKSFDVILQVRPYTATVSITDSGYQASGFSSALKSTLPLRDVPQSISVITKQAIRDQSMQSIGDVVRYMPGIIAIQGENNRDQVVIRGNSSSADFFLDGLRDDVQYYRDLYNLERLEALKGPNAMIFGRGGGGGVMNRVTKQPAVSAFRELNFEGGSFRNRRFTGDLNQPLNSILAFRVNGLYENSGSFRDHVNLNRFGINPTVSITMSNQTQIRFGYEHLRDNRIADRGIPSYQGRPAETEISTFFGNPDLSRVRARVNLLTGVFDHQEGKLNIRNRTLFGNYDRFYQNFVPSAVNADQTRVNLSAYNNSTRRQNVFNQTDLTYSFETGRVRHNVVGGAEFGYQVSRNFRNTGFFNNTTTILVVPFSDPTIDTPVTFRQSASDANNRVVANIAASYAQDQIEIGKRVQVLVGLRFDRFDLKFHNNRNDDDFGRLDYLVSPRAGIVFKPIEPLSIYGSYSVSYLPSSGDQFSSLTSVTQTLKPEKFSNYEVGTKWDVRPTLTLTAALYRLDRTNTRSVDPNDPTRIVQTGSQRTRGVELGLQGDVTRDWKIIGGYAYQDAVVTSATVSAPAGAHVAQVPRHTFSLWNNYSVSRKWRAGLGLTHRSDMFAAIDNRVILPGYTRADAAVFYLLTERLGVQLNLENLFNTKYFVNANSNDNITPGQPMAARVGVNWRF
jgi:catecholate siderophore receptor